LRDEFLPLFLSVTLDARLIASFVFLLAFSCYHGIYQASFQPFDPVHVIYILNIRRRFSVDTLRKWHSYNIYYLPISTAQNDLYAT
jgi:hypothetical protein